MIHGDIWRERCIGCTDKQIMGICIRNIRIIPGILYDIDKGIKLLCEHRNRLRHCLFIANGTVFDPIPLSHIHRSKIKVHSSEGVRPIAATSSVSSASLHTVCSLCCEPISCRSPHCLLSIRHHAQPESPQSQTHHRFHSGQILSPPPCRRSR